MYLAKGEGSHKLETVYRKSRDLVEQEIEGETIIIPVTSGIGDLERDILDWAPRSKE